MSEQTFTPRFVVRRTKRRAETGAMGYRIVVDTRQAGLALTDTGIVEVLSLVMACLAFTKGTTSDFTPRLRLPAYRTGVRVELVDQGARDDLAAKLKVLLRRPGMCRLSREAKARIRAQEKLRELSERRVKP